MLNNILAQKLTIESNLTALSMHLLGVWHGFNEYVKKLAVKYETVHVVTGPVFDYNADGKRDHTITR